MQRRVSDHGDIPYTDATPNSNLKETPGRARMHKTKESTSGHSATHRWVRVCICCYSATAATAATTAANAAAAVADDDADAAGTSDNADIYCCYFCFFLVVSHLNAFPITLSSN